MRGMTFRWPLCLLLAGLATASFAPQLDPALHRAELTSSQQRWERLAESHPKGRRTKAAWIAATVRLAEAYMYGADLAPKDKYRKALEFYRLALAADPANDLAKESATTIETIYESMGRPVPARAD